MAVTSTVPVPEIVFPVTLAAADVNLLLPSTVIVLSSVIAEELVIVTSLSPPNVKAVAGKVPAKVVFEPAFTVVVPDTVIPTKAAVVSPSNELTIKEPEPEIVLPSNNAAVDVKPLPLFISTAAVIPAAVIVITFPPLILNGASGKVPEKFVVEPALTIAPETSIPPSTAVVSPSKELIVILPPAPVIVLASNNAAVDIRVFPLPIVIVLLSAIPFSVIVTVLLEPSNVNAVAGKVPEKSVIFASVLTVTELNSVIPANTPDGSSFNLSIIKLPDPSIVVLLSFTASDLSVTPVSIVTVLPAPVCIPLLDIITVPEPSNVKAVLGKLPVNVVSDAALLTIVVPLFVIFTNTHAASPFNSLTVILPPPPMVLPSSKVAVDIKVLLPLIVIAFPVVIPFWVIVTILSPSRVKVVAGKLPVNVTLSAALTVVVPVAVIPDKTAPAVSSNLLTVTLPVPVIDIELA